MELGYRLVSKIRAGDRIMSHSGRGQLSKLTYSKRYYLVKSGKASWLNKYYTLVEAIGKAGL